MIPFQGRRWTGIAVVLQVPGQAVPEVRGGYGPFQALERQLPADFVNHNLIPVSILTRRFEAVFSPSRK